MVERNNVLPAITFYNLHAAEYNSRMSALDDKVRSIVRQYFGTYVSDGNVLDFGGGTGLDLLWLSEHYEKVFFLEPSAKMKAEAYGIAYTCHNVFFADNTDFNNWNDNSLPFPEKMNGVLANFAVFNCIKNIDTLFERLALICLKHSYLVILVINTSAVKLLRNYSLKFLLRAILNLHIEVANTKQGISHTTYLHTLKQYISAAKGYFTLIRQCPIAESNFSLLIFQKDE